MSPSRGLITKNANYRLPINAEAGSLFMQLTAAQYSYQQVVK
jgi:hypothetical protein